MREIGVQVRHCPHPRVTAVAKKTVTAAPLALSLDKGEGSEGSGCCRIEVLPVSPTVQKRRKNYTTYQYRRIPCFSPRRSKIRRARDCARNVRFSASRAANNDPHPRAPGALALSLKRARDLNYCSANHSDSSGLARSLALSFSRVAAARRIPVLPHVLRRNSGFLARAGHARGNDRKIRPSGRACHYLVQDSIVSGSINVSKPLSLKLE